MAVKNSFIPKALPVAVLSVFMNSWIIPTSYAQKPPPAYCLADTLTGTTITGDTALCQSSLNILNADDLQLLQRPNYLNEEGVLLVVGPGDYEVDGYTTATTNNRTQLTNPRLTANYNYSLYFTRNINATNRSGSLVLKNLSFDHKTNGQFLVFSTDSNTRIGDYKLTLENVDISTTGPSYVVQNGITYNNDLMLLYFGTVTKNPEINFKNVTVAGSAPGVGAPWHLMNVPSIPAGRQIVVNISGSKLEGGKGFFVTDAVQLNITDNSVITTTQSDGFVFSVSRSKGTVLVENSIIKAAGKVFDYSIAEDTQAGYTSTVRNSDITADAEILEAVGAEGTASKKGLDTLIQNSRLTLTPKAAGAPVLRLYRGGVVRVEGATLVSEPLTKSYGISLNWDPQANFSTTQAVLTGYNDPLTGQFFRNSLVTYGDGSHGLIAFDSSVVTIENTDINTVGDNAKGIYALGFTGGNLKNKPSIISLIGDNKIATFGNLATAAFFNNANLALLDDLRIRTSGQDSIGLHLKDSVLTPNWGKLVINTSGANAHGIILEDSKTPSINLNQSQVQTAGANTAALLLDTSTTNLTTRTDLVFNLNQSSLIAGADLADPTTLANPLGFAMATTTSYTKALTANLNQSQMYGDVAVQGASNVTVNLTNNSSWRGSALAYAGNYVSRVNIDAGNTWTVQNTSEVKDLINSGSVILNQPTLSGSAYTASDYYTLTVHGDYVSNNGSLVLNQELNDTELGDTLFIEGNVTGNTKLFINPTESSGAATTGNGILMVYAGAPYAGDLGAGGVPTRTGAPLSEGLFALQNSLFAGAYEYSLVYRSANADMEAGWYLVSELAPTPPPPGPGPIPQPPEPPKPIQPEPPKPIQPEPPVQNYRPLAVAGSTLPSMVQLMGRTSLATYHDRMGGLDQGDDNLAWARSLLFSRGFNRLSGNASQRQQQFLEYGASYDMTIKGLQVGRDLYRTRSESDTTSAGVYLSALQGEGDVQQVYTEDNAGSNDLQSRALGMYWTRRSDTGISLDAVAELIRYNRLTVQSANQQESFTTKGTGISASLEASTTYDLGQRWTVEPQMQVVYQTISIDDGVSGNTFVIDYDAANHVYGRLGARLSRSFTTDSQAPMLAWAKLNVWSQLNNDKNTSTIYGGNRDQSTAQSMVSVVDNDWAELGLGAEGALSKQTSIEASATYLKGLNSRSTEGVMGQVNLRHRW